MKVTNKEIFLDDLENLKEYINKKENLLLWGAGFYLNLLFDKCSAIDENFKKKIEFIIVSDIKDNPTEVEGIPVREYSNKVNLNGKTIILALGHRYKKDIIGVIAEAGAEVVTVDFNIFQENTYHNILKMIEPFMLVYPFNSTSTNMPCFGNRTKMLFTCWWQGEEEAPDLIRACIRSQKRNIPKEIRHVVISKYNYGEYIDIPDFVLQKVESGKISLTTLSDIIRVSLLYKWGGGWIDSTVLLTHMIDVNIFNYPFYTRNIPEKQYCTNIVWSDWFMFAQAGSELFRFVMEAFYYYFQHYEKIVDYFMIDYLIAIAYNHFEGVRIKMANVPYNNEKAMELCKHLNEKYTKEKFLFYNENCCMQKLSYKNICNDMKNEDNFVEMIIHNM